MQYGEMLHKWFFISKMGGKIKMERGRKNEQTLLLVKIKG